MDITPYDKNITTNNANGNANNLINNNGTNGDDQAYTKILKGTPKILLNPLHEGKTLFLCYPDDSNGMANKCLDYFNGEMMITTGSNCGPPQSTWGKLVGMGCIVCIVCVYCVCDCIGVCVGVYWFVDICMYIYVCIYICICVFINCIL